ncbi:MAG: cupin domain-containing protein [Dehalococcoidales bacterium]
MKVAKYTETEATLELPGVLKREVINASDGAPNFCMRVFDLEPGSSTPSHSHAWEHEVYILTGKGVVESEDGEKEISRDTVVFVAPDEHHRFRNTSFDTLRFICVIPLES